MAQHHSARCRSELIRSAEPGSAPPATASNASADKNRRSPSLWRRSLRVEPSDHWTTLMRVYRLTGDEKYAREVVSQLLDWTADFPVPELDSGNQTQTWRTIECGLA